MKDIIVVGAGGFGTEVMQLIQDCNCDHNAFNILGFVDDDLEKAGTEIGGLPVLGSLNFLEKFGSNGLQRRCLALGVGSPELRQRFFERLASYYEFPAFIHPTVIVGDRVRIGSGALVTAGNILTVDIVVHEQVVLNLSCTVGHGAEIGAFTVVNPHVSISGGVHIGDGVLVGTGASILQDLNVGEWSVIGGGALVNKHVPANATSVGVPAVVIKQREPGWQSERFAKVFVH